MTLFYSDVQAVLPGIAGKIITIRRYSLYLMGIVSCRLTKKGTLVFVKDIFSCVHISKGYGVADYDILCYIYLVLLGGGYTNNPLHLTH